MIIKREGKTLVVYNNLTPIFKSNSLEECQRWIANNSGGKLKYSEYYQSVVSTKKYVR